LLAYARRQPLAPKLTHLSPLLNLAVNARDAMPNGGRLIIEATNVCIDKHASEFNQEATPGDCVLLAVKMANSSFSTSRCSL
jgi:hypothetical protein